MNLEVNWLVANLLKDRKAELDEKLQAKVDKALKEKELGKQYRQMSMQRTTTVMSIIYRQYSL